MNKNGYRLVIIEKSQRCSICAEVKATKFVKCVQLTNYTLYYQNIIFETHLTENPYGQAKIL